MATSDLTGDLDQARRHAAGRTNSIVRDGNSFSANTPIRQGATVDGQPMAATNTYSGQGAARPSAPAPSRQPMAQLPPGIGLTPDQQAAQRRTQQQQAMGQRLSQDRQAISDTVSTVTGATGGGLTNRLLMGALPAVASGPTFDDRLPGQANREAARARQQARQSADWVANNPEQAQAAQQYGQGIVERARTTGMTPPGGYPGISAPTTQQPIAGVASRSPAPGAPSGANPLTGSAPPSAPGVPAAGSPGQQPGQPIARIEPGQNLAPDLTRNARARLPVNSMDNRVVRDGNSFSANTPIRAGATIGSTDTLVGRQQDDGQPMARINSYSGQSAMDSNLLAAQIHRQTRLENSNPNYLNVVRDSGRSGIQGELNRRENKALEGRQRERRGEHQQLIAMGQQELNQALQQRRTNAVAADERLYTRSQDAIAEQRNQLGDQLTDQQIRLGQMSVEQQRQLRELSSRMVDPSLTAADRAEAQRAYQALTTTGSDTLRAQSERDAARQRAIVDLYRQYSGLSMPPVDSENNPIPFEVWAQPALGAMDQGKTEQQQPRRSTVTRAEVEQTAANRGMTPDQLIRMLGARGVTVSS